MLFTHIHTSPIPLRTRLLANLAVTEVVIEVTPAPYPAIEAHMAHPPDALQPLNDLVHNKDAGFLTRTFSTKGWTRRTVVQMGKQGQNEIVTYRGRKIPVSGLLKVVVVDGWNGAWQWRSRFRFRFATPKRRTKCCVAVHVNEIWNANCTQVSALDDLLLRVNGCHISTLRLDFTPELEYIPQRLFETLFVPGLRVLHFEQPLPHSCVDALAGFVQGDTGRDLQIIRINRLRLTEEAIQSLVQGLIQAQVPYIGYKFEKGGPGLEIDLRVHNKPRLHRRGSSDSVIVVPRY